ncbi:MAG TPA: HEAT repeat domain-containing protein [Anaeromyxobacter sp.]
MRHTAAALTAFVAAAALALAGCGNPKDPEGWAKRAASRSRLDEKLQALGEVRKAPGDRKAAVPALVEIVKDPGTHPRARAEAAVALGEIGDPAAIPALLAAANPAATERDAMELNRHVADALGELRAREAVPVLKSLTSSPDGFTQVAAVDALGKIGDPAAVDTLVAIATGERIEPFTAKKALLALGRIGDARAGPPVMQMLFEERPGVSFFPEAAFAVVEIGPPMSAPLLAVLEGKDEKLAAWAREHRVVPGALYAKSAQLLGDVGGPDAVPPLVKKLSYQDSDAGIATYVRVFAAESLGRLRARDAARPLAELAAREKDPDVRDRYCDALARIGDPDIVPVLRSAAAAAPSWELREGPLVALSRLGGEPERKVVDEARAKQCARGCAPAVEAAYEAMRARLDAAKACANAACWAGKLGDASAAVRDRAALEVGRAGGAAQAGALGDAIVRPVSNEGDLAARYHAVLALTWISAREKLGKAGADAAAKIEAMLVQDRGRTLTAGVNEDALRLATRLQRAAR